MLLSYRCRRTMLFREPGLYGSGLWAGRKVGLLGGSFNPAHEGHRHISLLALKMLRLDAVWWLVSPQNPLKSAQGMQPLDVRLHSARKASDHPAIIPTAIERDLGTRYTADTVAALQHHFHTTHFVWLMGSDNLHQFHKWKNWQAIFNRVPVAVFDRPPGGNSLKTSVAGAKFQSSKIDETNAASLALRAPPCWTIFHTPLNPLSSTALRSAAGLE